MIKFILCVVLVLSATLIGNSFALKLSNRRKTLDSIVKAISRMKTMICFGSIETVRIVEDCFCTQDFPLLSLNQQDDVLPFNKKLSSAIDKIPLSFSLTKSDKELLSEFGSELGSTDVTGQVAHTDLYSQLFSERLEYAKEQESAKTKLYRILGFSLGCAISILIV